MSDRPVSLAAAMAALDAVLDRHVAKWGLGAEAERFCEVRETLRSLPPFPADPVRDAALALAEAVEEWSERTDDLAATDYPRKSIGWNFIEVDVNRLRKRVAAKLDAYRAAKEAAE